MWSSTLPTGTIQNEQRANRTFPQSSQTPNDAQPHRQTQSAASPAGCSRTTPHAEVERLRDENRQLRSELESLRSQRHRHEADKQALIDRYERLIADLELAAATRPSASAGSNARANRRAAERGLLERLTDWL